MKRAIPGRHQRRGGPDACARRLWRRRRSQPSPNAPVTITLAGWSLATTPEFKTLADGFHAPHPNVTVELKEYDAGQLRHPDDRRPRRRHRTGRLRAEEPQELLHLPERRSAARRLRRGRGLGRKRRRLASYQVDGKTYAVPYRQDSWVLYYNKDLFDEGRRSTPRTAAGPGTTTPTRPSSSPPG